jgi:translation initiation factor 2B subunit (eIF-2B alpha/beta/delta family)
MPDYLDSLPKGSRDAIAVYADPHPPGAVQRARYAGRSIVELARAWPAEQPGLPGAVDELVAYLKRTAQTTLHQPGINNFLVYLLAEGVPENASEAAQLLSARQRAGEDLLGQAQDRCAQLGADLLKTGDTVLVNDFGPSSMHAIVARAARDGKRLHVIATACRTRRAHGIRAALEAKALGHDATVTTDSGLGWAISRGGIRAAFIGADSFLPDGSVLTTNGALAIAAIGREYGLEVYSVYDLWKLLPAWTPELSALNNLQDPDGVPESADWVRQGLDYLNPLVDCIPGSLFTAAITDVGIIPPAQSGAEALRRYGAELRLPVG